MNSFAYGVITAKRKGNVRHTTGNTGVWQMFFDPACGIYKIDGVVVVLFNAGRDSENVGVENNIGRMKTHDFCQDLVGACADFRFALKSVRLSLFIKGHHHDCCTKTSAFFGLVDELLFAFFKADGVHHAFTLYALKARDDDIPFGGIQHNGYAGNIRFASN